MTEQEYQAALSKINAVFDILIQQRLSIVVAAEAALKNVQANKAIAVGKLDNYREASEAKPLIDAIVASGLPEESK